MNFRKFVDHPVKVVMFFLAVALMGVLAYKRLPLNLFPDIQTPRITVVVKTEGLAPEEAERVLAPELEQRFVSIKGLAAVTTYCRESSLVAQADFHWGEDMEFAYLDVKKGLGALEANENVKGLDIYRFDPNAAPLMTLAFTGAVDRVQATAFVENSLRPKLETIEGVARVQVNGASRQDVVVLADEDLMAQYGLTPDSLLQAVKQANLVSGASAGVVVEGNQRMTLKFVSRLRNVADIRRCVIKTVENFPIHLEDIGKIEIREKRDDTRVRLDGRETVSLDIFREPDANAVFTARRLRTFIGEINNRGDFGLKIAIDRSLDIEAAIREVVDSALVGMVLAVLVLFVFLRNIAATLVTALAIPLSIVATFVLMYLQGLSMNIMTLGGLAIGVGMLVDNGIVVIDNIFRQRQNGVAAPTAAAEGTREVAGAITASTLTTVVVFVPLVYVHGIAGILFKDQALTVVYSLMMSLLVALVLVPMLGARLGRTIGGEKAFSTQLYGRFLSASLRYRWLLLVVFSALMWVTWIEMRGIPVEFFPEGANGRLSVALEMPPGTPLERTEAAARQLETRLLSLRYRDQDLAPLLTAYETWKVSGDADRFQREAAAAADGIVARFPQRADLAQLKEIFVLSKGKTEGGGAKSEEARLERLDAWLKSAERFLDPMLVVETISTAAGSQSESAETGGDRIVGANTARMEVVLNPHILRELSAADVARALRAEAQRIPDLKCSFESRDEFLSQLLGKGRGDIVYEIHAEDLASLRQAAEAARQEFARMPGLANARTNLQEGEDEFILEPDSEALLRAKCKIADLSAQVRDFLRGAESDKLNLDQGDMAISIRNLRAEGGGLEALLNLPIVCGDSFEKTQEKLSNLVSVRRQKGVREIMRVNQEKTLLVMADLQGVPYGDAIRRAEEGLNAIPWTKGVSWNVSGEEVKRRESFQKLFFALIVAIVLVYMVIAAILESIVHPFTIMLSVPFALTGVVAAFLMAGISLNLMGYIGSVMLVGIVVNNAIVLLDRVRQIRDEGATAAEALVAAGRQRLRPILMTSLTTILALIPLAMGFGEGAELRRPLAVAVLGGLTASTVLTLWLLPGIYLCVEDVLGLIRRPAPRAAAAVEPEP